MNPEMHINHLKITFDKIRNAKLKLNFAKCEFGKTELKILGHIISEKCIKMDSEKIEAINNMKLPTSIKELQIFLGLTGYYRKFIEKYAHIAGPLFNLLKKDTEYQWSKECQGAWEALKEKLISYPILTSPNPILPFQLHTDASGVALGAILSQNDQNGHERVVAYASRTLSDAEKHYGISEKECLGVVWGIKMFRTYLAGSKFTVLTDHSALKWLLTLKDVTGKLARWAIYLQSYDFEVYHRAGKNHSNVDALTRLTTYMIQPSSRLGDPSSKSIDHWEDDNLITFLRTGNTNTSLSNNHKKRIERASKSLSLSENKLFINTKRGRKEIPKIEDRQRIIDDSHILGHFGFRSTYDRLKENFYWKHMSADIKNIIDRCQICLRFESRGKMEHNAKAIPITNINDRIGIDLIFGLPESTKGHIGIMVITEYLSKYPEAYPIKSKSSEEIAKNLLNYISKFGPPKTILTDQGKEFTNQIIEKLYNINGIEHRITSSYNPRCNGLTERFNQTLINSLRKHSEEHPERWDEWIPFVLWAYRSRIHSSTGYSPYELLFGKKMNEMLCNDNDKTADQTDTKSSLENRIAEIKELLDKKIHLAKNKIEKAQERQKVSQDKQNKKLLTPPLKEGDQVLLKNTGLLTKMQPRYSGPYIVSHLTSSGNYWIKTTTGTLLQKSFPITQLKKIPQKSKQDSPGWKILHHKREDGKILYYLKEMQGNGSNDGWVDEGKIVTLSLYEPYWKKITRTESDSLQETANN